MAGPELWERMLSRMRRVEEFEVDGGGGGGEEEFEDGEDDLGGLDRFVEEELTSVWFSPAGGGSVRG